MSRITHPTVQGKLHFTNCEFPKKFKVFGNPCHKLIPFEWFTISLKFYSYELQPRYRKLFLKTFCIFFSKNASQFHNRNYAVFDAKWNYFTSVLLDAFLRRNVVNESSFCAELTCFTVTAVESSHTRAVVRVYSVDARSSIMTWVSSTIINTESIDWNQFYSSKTLFVYAIIWIII